MARLPRLTLPGCVHHVLQRGNNRQAIFASAADREALLALLAEQAAKHRVAVHGYVLLDNQFQLLATPETADGLPQMMQAVGRRYVRGFNDRQQRSGTLWEGRYRSTLIQAERQLLPCLVFLDLAPVRAGLVTEPREHPWSSHAHYIGQRADRLVTPHPLCWQLGNTPFAREAAYAEMVRAGLPAHQQEELARALERGWPLGDERFVADLQGRTGRRVRPAKPGRPASSPRPGTARE